MKQTAGRADLLVCPGGAAAPPPYRLPAQTCCRRLADSPPDPECRLDTGSTFLI